MKNSLPKGATVPKINEESSRNKRASHSGLVKKPKLDFDRVDMNQERKRPKIKRKFWGTVVADKMDKTIIVLVSVVKFHPLYEKRYRRDKRYKVHDPKNKYKVGDKVVFVPSRPHSKDKRWEVFGSK